MGLLFKALGRGKSRLLTIVRFKYKNVFMRKMLVYRIFPTKKQETRLNETLHECRWLYNHLLEMRKKAYEQEGTSLSCYGQQATYPMLKQERPSLSTVHS